MSLADLFLQDGVFKFANNNLDRTAFQSDHWTFLHIPKTAGSSFREEIANVLQPDYNVEVDYTELDKKNSNQDFTEKINTAIDRYVTSYFGKARFVSGHMTYREIACHEQFESSKLISMIREPVARLRSDYLFRTSQEHPLWEAEAERYPDFRSYIEDPDNQNVMHRYLCRDETEPLDQMIDFVLDRYTFIGLQEMYTFSIKVVFMLFGQRIEPKLRLRDSQMFTTRSNPLAEPDIAAARELNGKDLYLYNFFNQKYDSIKSAFFLNIDFDRIFKRLNGLPFDRTPGA